MRAAYILTAALMTATALSGCKPPIDDPNVMYSDDHQDPIKRLETDVDIDKQSLPYQQTFYVPIYSNIYVDEDNPKVLLSATLSIRNTSLEHSLYVTKIDYYNTGGDFVRSYLSKSIELPPMGTLNYIVEKLDDTGGDGANFVVNIEGESTKTKPVIEAIMIGNYSNKGFAFETEAVPISNTD
ncbi:DUF3124 domain-containing protein [Psychrobacter pygoscelis]|uniref:DUF3124 domain-containing protein n=1 Tax=Psychrobacter pygoscelis TaxID=2488563 RepID=UPI00103BE800|nr:DUF3124 domain-containing protein [Psychrobacter pygoscelis]